MNFEKVFTRKKLYKLSKFVKQLVIQWNAAYDFLLIDRHRHGPIFSFSFEKKKKNTALYYVIREYKRNKKYKLLYKNYLFRLFELQTKLKLWWRRNKKKNCNNFFIRCMLMHDQFVQYIFRNRNDGKHLSTPVNAFTCQIRNKENSW